MKYIYLLVLVLSVLRGNTQTTTTDSLNSLEKEMTTSSSNPYALIAGGSKGIGYALAEAWAKRKYNLVLIARHWDSLSSAKQKLESAYGIHVELLSYDLSKEGSA